MSISAENVLENLGFRKYQKLLFVVCCEAVAIGIGSAMLISLIIPSMPEISNAQKGILGAGLNMGLLLSGGFLGSRADKLGREKIFKNSSYLILAGLLALVVARNFYQVCLGFLVLGVGSGADLAVTNSLLMESIPKTSRKYLALLAIAMNLGAGLVYSIALGLEYWEFRQVENWRLIAVTLFSVHLCFTYLRTFLKESPMFLYQQSKLEDFEKVVREIAEFNGDKAPQLDKLEKPQTNQKLGFGSLFKHPLKKSTLLLMSIFFLTFLAIQGITMFMPRLLPMESKLEKYIIITLQQVGSIPGKLLGAKSIDSFLGRKHTITLGFLGMSMSILGFSSTTDFWLINLVSLLFACAVNLAISGLYAITPESYPTYGRSLGMGFLMGFSRCGALLSPMITGTLLDTGGVSFVVVNSSFLFLVIAGIAMFLEETKNKSD